MPQDTQTQVTRGFAFLEFSNPKVHHVQSVALHAPKLSLIYHACAITASCCQSSATQPAYQHDVDQALDHHLKNPLHGYTLPQP